MKKLFSLLAALVALTLCGGEIDLSALSPSYTAAAGKLDIAVLLQMPQVRQFLPPQTAAANGVCSEDITRIFFGCDARLKRGFAICQFRDAAAWQRLWKTLETRLKPLPAERRILLFELDGGDVPGKLYFAVLAPQVAGIYYVADGGSDFRCDYAGCPGPMRKIYRSAEPFVCGGSLKNVKGPLAGIKYFHIALARDRDGQAAICGDIVCRDPVSATLTTVALQGAISVVLQDFCGLTSPQTVDFMNQIKMYQTGKKIRIEFSDFHRLSRIMQKLVAQP